MSFNGSGVFNVNSAGQPVVASTLITSAAFNAFTTDVATALSTCILKDGQQTVTANIPFGGNKLTGVAAGTARTDAANIGLLQDGTGVYVATVGGTVDVITLTPSPAITAYTAGQSFKFIAAGANTTNVTVNVSGLGAKAITKNGAAALVAGDIASGMIVWATYDGTRFILGAVNSVSLSTFTTAGDIVQATGSAAVARLGIGSAGQVPTVNAGATALEYTTSVFTTGDVKLTLKTAADSGWVLMNDTTIGNAASGGTGRANADTVNLFTLLWTNTADAQCAVSTGRGASAAADYAANKTIALPKALGRALATYGAGSGLTSRALALTTGVETHPLTSAENGAHTHLQDGTTVLNTGASMILMNGSGDKGAAAGGTTGSAGSGTAHQNMQPSLFLNTMIKL